MRFSYNLFILFVLLFLVGCNNNKDKDIPDVSGVTVNLKIHRFDQELFRIDTNQVAMGIEQLEEKYPDFTKFYLERVLQIKKPWDTVGLYREYIGGFLTYPFVRILHEKVDQVYSNFAPIQEDLEEGFRFYKYYFPENEVPEIYTFVSEFTYGIVLPPEGNTLAIGLDFFLGEDFEYYYYPPLSLPRYIARTYDKQHLVSKVFKGIIEDLAGPVKGNRFIDHIIHNGKKTYILDKLLPYTQDSIKLGFTTQQLEWVETNELDTWVYLLKEEIMYSDDYQNFKSLVSIAPRSAGMPEESPGEVGNWVGWQIVKAYMNRNPQITLSQLLAEEDLQQILIKSKYKPKR